MMKSNFEKIYKKSKGFGFKNYCLSFVISKLKKQIFYNYKPYCKNKIGHALLYYKSDQFVISNNFIDLRRSSKGYTSNWEEVEIARVLNRLGFWVDIVDRSVNPDFLPEDKYDIFIGNGAGNSGKFYAKYAEKLSKAVRIFYANGPEPELSNKLQQERYKYFSRRHPGILIEYQRMITQIDIKASMNYTDVIFCFGNEFSINSYKKFNKPVYPIIPSTSSIISTDISQLYSKQSNKFLYFGGPGNVVKGLDVLLEAFKSFDNAELYICAPFEEAFMEYYKDILEFPNIHYMGFIRVGGTTFNKLTNECGYIIFPSSSEGTATSVITCMQRGLIPVVTYETGVDVENFGFLISDFHIESLQKQINDILNISDHEFYQRVLQTYIYARRFSEDRFSKNLEEIIIRAILTKKGSTWLKLE